MPEERALEFQGGHWMIFLNGVWQGLGTVYPGLAAKLRGVDDSDMEQVQAIMNDWAAAGGEEPGPVGSLGELEAEETRQQDAKPFWWNEQIEAKFPWETMGWVAEKDPVTGKYEYTKQTSAQWKSDLEAAKVYAEALGGETKKPATAGSLDQQIADAVARKDMAEARRLRQQQVELKQQGEEEATQQAATLVPGESVGGPPGSIFIRQPNGTLTPWTPAKQGSSSIDEEIDRLILAEEFDAALQLDAIRDQISGRGENGLSYSEGVRLVMGVAETPQEARQWLDSLFPRPTPQAGPFTYLEPESIAPYRTQAAPQAVPSMIPLQQARQLQPGNFPTPGEGAIPGEGPFGVGGVAGPGGVSEEQAAAALARGQQRVPFFEAPPPKAPVGVRFDPETGEPIAPPFGSGLLAPPVPNPLADTRLSDQSQAGQRAALASLRNRMPAEEFQALMLRASRGEQISPTSFPGPFIPPGLAKEFRYTSPEAARRGEIEEGTQAFQAAEAKGEPEESVRARWNQAGGNVNVFQGQPLLNPFEQVLFDIEKKRRKPKAAPFQAPSVRFA